MGQSNIASTSHKLHFQFVPNEPQTKSGTYYIDIAQCLSMTQRRSYRQGMNYAVNRMSFAYVPVESSDDFTSIDVSIIPTTWVADNATTKAYEYWRKQRAEVLEEQPSLQAKWADFKIFMDAEHSSNGVVKNLIPAAELLSSCRSQQLYELGDWNAAEMVIPKPGADQATAGDAQEVLMHVVGDHTPAGAFDGSTTAVGLITAYAESRALVLAPDPAPLGQFVSGFYNVNQSDDEKSQDIMTNVTYKNDNPPYNLLKYPGADTNANVPQLVSRLYPNNFGGTTFDAAGDPVSNLVASMATTGPFVAPFGLIKIETCGLSTGYDYINLELELVPGDYKGILAEKGV